LKRNGIATTGKTQLDAAKNIIKKGKIINKTTGSKADVRYVEWRKYIKTHKFPHRHTSPTSGMVESMEKDVVGVEGEGESDNDTSLGDETTCMIERCIFVMMTTQRWNLSCCKVTRKMLPQTVPE
jgi:hypothetical protein